MACLPKGYVIPRLVAGDRVASVAHGGLDSAAGAGAVHDYDSQRQTRNQFAMFRARCEFCRDFHDKKSYCFRHRIFSTMPRSRSRSRSRTSSESESESQDSDSAGSEAGVKESAGELLLQDKHGPPVDVTQLEKFFSSKKRIDAPEEKLVLQSPTVAMYFRDLLGQGKLDKDSAKELRKKYYMGDKSYKALAPPTLSDTKLHMIQTHEAGGVYNKFLGIHINHRDSLKLFLRSYELLGGCADVFEGFEPMHPYVEDAVVDKFELPTLTSVVKEVSDTEIEQLLPVSSDGIVDIEELRKLARSKIALSKLVEKQGSAYLDVLELLQKATNVAVVGVSMHGNLTDIMVA
jgi:hypothetical protein